VPAIHVIPGAGCTSVHVEPLANVLALRYPTQVVTLPEHSSCGNPSGCTLGDYARHVVQGIKGPTVLVGHSMGGLAAQLAAAGSPHVCGLVLLASAPPPRIRYRGAIWWRIPRYLPALLSGEAFTFTARDLKDLFLHERQDPDAVSTFRSESGAAVREMVLGQFYGTRPRVSCPVYVIAGEEDALIPLAVQKRIAARYRAPLRVVRGGGHMLASEPWATGVASLIASWLRANGMAPESEAA
jgi:pimeloyl-ACP methyl ester carboxylesterase